MTTALETFRAEMFARLQAGTYGVAVADDSIRRSHKTTVTRERCPAVYLSFPEIEFVKEHGGCSWDWKVRYRVTVFTADDDGDKASDAIVDGVLGAINPEAPDSTATPLYSNGVTVYEPKRVRVAEDVGDEDPTQVEIEGYATLPTQRWSFAAV